MSQPQPIQPLPYDPAPYLQARDLCHLNLLATFHYVGGGITLTFACISLIHVPIGTVLGVFTLIVLLRDSVNRLYGVEVAPPPPLWPPC